MRNRRNFLYARDHKARALRVLGLLVLALAIFATGSKESEAKLDPFYVLRGQSFAQFKPRILFAVDTSGSMTWRPTVPNQRCPWQNCENAGNPTESRISSARRAINQVVEATGDSARFSLMTFGHAAPPTSAAQVPSRCNVFNAGIFTRFVYADISISDGWGPSWGPFNNVGLWIMCGDNRPFPYLRHDELGDFALPDDSNAPLPDNPLYVQYSDLAGYQNTSNAFRRVQFMPQFLGRRFNLDCADPQERAVLNRSHGDFGEDNPTRQGNMCGRDFYYWPYVDGFPRYSSDYLRTSFHPSTETDCNDAGGCWTSYDSQYRAGVNRRDYNTQGTLYAPFFSQAAIDSGSVPVGAKGPRTEEEGEAVVAGLTDPMFAGGIDATGGTPWATTVGDVDTYVSKVGDDLVPKGALLSSNAAFSHQNIASYLSFILTVSDEDLCIPTAAVLISDGQPSPWSTEGSTPLFSRLHKLRNTLGVKAYVVGFAEGFQNDATAFGRLQSMACSAAGSTNTGTPCLGPNTHDWDTCSDPDDPTGGCAYTANDPDALAAALLEIVQGEIETPIPSGPGHSVNEFVVSNDEDDTDALVIQSKVEAYTESPGWFGHVVRGACSIVDETTKGGTCTSNDDCTSDEICRVDHLDPQGGSLFCYELDQVCLDAQDEGVITAEQEDFSGGETGCSFSRDWDAGVCLRNRTWTERKLYTHDDSNNLIRISNPDGSASGAFKAVLTDVLSPPLTFGQEDEEADEIVAFLLGQNLPNSWKLPGLANSSPIVVRRVPQQRIEFAPSIGIRDPHCAGRNLPSNAEVPASLIKFANEAWEEGPVGLTSGGGYGMHYDYAEAVLIGDDFGVLHGFHLDTGNELFGFLPRALLNHARDVAQNGTANFGQLPEIDKHLYGLASTVNQGWAFDHDEQKWRHLAVFGFGPGGTEVVALDVSHMGRLADDDPVEVLWTTETVNPGMQSNYDDGLGETWSRPALTYAVENEAFQDFEPRAYLVFQSGYRDAGPQYRGRSVWMVDAITGETVWDTADFALPAAGSVYGVDSEFAAVGDVAVGTHCTNGYWGEMQEVYMADPAGRLYRWDLGADENSDGKDLADFSHEADSGIEWSSNGGFGDPVIRFAACQGTNEFSCSVAGAAGPGVKGDVFTFSPAVVATNRIDEVGEALPVEATERDRFVVALASGSPFDDAIDGGDDDNDFHSSIYLLADNHQAIGTEHGGFSIPGLGAVTPPGGSSTFMRLPLSDIERTRTIIYPDGTEEQLTRFFNKKARPLRAPRVVVTAVVDPDNENTVAENVEAFFITFTVYEPGEQTCDEKWKDPDTDEWVFDAGSTYEITFRLVVDDTGDIDFNNAYVLPGTLGSGALQLESVTQVREDCPGGNCGAQLGTPANKPCDPNVYGNDGAQPYSVQTGWSELDGFSPLEL